MVFLRWTLTLSVITSFACTRSQAPQPPGEYQNAEGDGPSEPHRLSATRQLRRIDLTLLGSEPRPEEYQALSSADDAAKEAILARAIEDALSSPQFYEEMLKFGRDYLRVGAYEPGTIDNSSWIANQAVQLTPCETGTLHSGKLGIFFPNNLSRGDPPSICNDPSARTDSIQNPWFAPGTTVQTIGRAGTGVTQSSTGPDCGGPGILDQPVADASSFRIYTPAQDCSCGPNLIYCHPTQYDSAFGPLDGQSTVADSQRRAAWDEPGRLFAHIVTQDKPFSDLVLGDYTVVNLKLQHMYVRLARLNPAHRSLDSSAWFAGVTDPAAWRPVPFQSMHPNLLSRRSYALDPRTTLAEPEGIPAAGVLTSLGSMAAFARERVRGARWSEIFACRTFSAPPSTESFSPFQGDPYSGGQCQHCHRAIDPAAIYFKRPAIREDGPLIIGGIGPGKWDDGLIDGDPFSRWIRTFQPNTFLTPISPSELAFNPNARFLDFLPMGSTLFGSPGDGTIGPLGFAKLVVESGEFDSCAVRHFYERFLGRALDPTTESPLIQQLTQQFQAGGRKVKPFVRQLLSQDAFRRGW